MTHLTRRSVLAAGGALGAASLAAACGADAGTPATSSAAPASSGGAATPLGPVADVPVGGGVVYDAQQIVVTQPQQGTIKGFSAVCPHQGCLVSTVSDNEIVCPCHGSLFSAEDGSVIQGPAKVGLAVAPVSVQGDSVVLG